MTRDSVFIPDHPSQFSTEWLASKLNQPAEKLNGFTFEPVGTGQVGDSYRLHLDWNMAGDLPPSLVVKCPAADPTSRQTGANMHLYEIETRWYQTLANASGVRVPHIYFADIAENMTDFVLLMADCAPAGSLTKWPVPIARKCASHWMRPRGCTRHAGMMPVWATLLGSITARKMLKWSRPRCR